MSDSRGLVRVLDHTVLFLFVVQFCYRGLVSSLSLTLTSDLYTASFASNFLAAGLVLLTLILWLVRRFLEGGMTLRITGVEFWFLGFVMASILSMLGASYKLPAISYIVGWGGLLALFVLIIHGLGPERIGLMIRLVLTLGGVMILYALLQTLFLFDQMQASPDAERLQETEVGAIAFRDVRLFSTFFYQNIFAGFLVFLCPLLAGLLVDAWRGGRRGRGLASLGTLLALALLCLGLSSSKGGWGAALFAFGFLAWRLTGKRAVLIGLILLCIAGGIGMAVTQSMDYRLVYWESALRMFLDQPALGVGLDNYQEHYSAHKSDAPFETKMAHNDYLQLLAEVGVPGLLVFLGMLFWFGRSVRRDEPDPAPVTEARDSPWIVGSAWVTGLGLAWLLDGSLDYMRTPLLVLLLAVSGLLYYLLLSKRDVEPFGRGAQCGLVAGLAGVGVHMLSDFHLYEHNLVQFLVLGAAVVLLAGRRFREVPAQKWVPAFVGIVMTGVTVFFILLPYGTLARGQVQHRRARQSLARYEESQDPKYLLESIRQLDAALEEHRWDPEMHRELGRARRRFAAHLRPSDVRAAAATLRENTPEAEKNRERLQAYRDALGGAVHALQNSLDYRPRHEDTHREISSIHLEVVDLLDDVGPYIGSRAESEKRFHLNAAIRHAEVANRLYPTRAAVQYHLGAVYRRDGNRDRQDRAWREARRLHGLATLREMKLAEEQVREIERFLDPR